MNFRRPLPLTMFMTDAREQPGLEDADDADEPVFHWRLEQLEAAGYDTCSAIELASRDDVDLHLALDLRARGCPAETAARILA
jgi:hypothetical protein